MNRYLLATLFLCYYFLQSFAQTTLPNLDLEGWATMTIDTIDYYEEPTGGIWTTANRAVLLNPLYFKVTTFKTEDAHSGTYAAKIVTDMIHLPSGQDLLMTGTLATGTFNELAPPPDNLKMGVPFTDRPVRFKTWFKYIPVNHDSTDMWCMLTKWNPAIMGRDTIGVAWYTDTVTFREYSLLNMQIVYNSEEIPDSISLVYAPSAAGDLFLGQEGSVLYVDDISLEYSNGFNLILLPEVEVKYFPNPADHNIRFELSKEVKDGHLQIFDALGREIYSAVFSGQIISVDLSGYVDGTFYYFLSTENSPLNSGIFMKSVN
jgi:hypothetical protein